MAENGEGLGKGPNNPANGMLRDVTDADGDGSVTRDEFLGAVLAWFDAMDRNRDSVITTEDFSRN